MLRVIYVLFVLSLLAQYGDALSQIRMVQSAPTVTSSSSLGDLEAALKKALSFRASYLTFSDAGKARVREAAAMLEARALQKFDAVQERSLLSGNWKLEYSNNDVQIPRFLPLAPLKLGKVLQCWKEDGTVDNVVSLQSAIGSPVDLELQHDVKVLSTQYPATFEISLQAVRVGKGGQGVTLPLPLAQKSLGAGVFDVTYVSDELRITRGVYGELRIFSRDC